MEKHQTIKEDLIYRTQINNNITFVATFTHPSAHGKNNNWGWNENTPYLTNTVKPTIAEIKKLIFMA